ncbi:hypothetical protein B5E41_17595 [Rhizobium esperanzae]|uniref:Uncharacterized protein n=1 Tax=Rhizobium esperanzae TaxID=1967781 RepID=A0A246DVL7_9HYPH|nr:hypothetical protein [Rhizobium esperanzae]OWO93588.1 hypothetical protein B5E41_17595 [Rhizobium esperanzae]
MNSHEDEGRQNAFTGGKSKGGAAGRYSMDIGCDRRIEPARLWTVYHANVPAHTDQAVIGASRSQGRRDILSVNLLNIGYRKEWLRLSDAAQIPRETPVQPWR